MATRFAAETDSYQVGLGSMPGGAAAWTVVTWVKLTAEWAGTRPAWAAAGAGGDYLGVGVDATPEAYAGAFSPYGVLVAEVEPLPAGVWYRTAAVGAADGTVTLWWGAGAAGELHSIASSPTALALVSVDTLYLGGSHIPGVWLDGSLANVKQYAALLTEGEIEAEWASWDAVRTADLVRHHRLQTPELADYSGNGWSLTAGATSPVLDADDPPITPAASTGALSGSTPSLAGLGGALAGQVRAVGALAGTVSSLAAPGGDLEGLVRAIGSVAGALPALGTPGGQLAGSGPVLGSLAGSVPALAVPGGQLLGLAGADGAAAGFLAPLGSPGGQVDGSVRTAAQLAGSLPLLAELAGHLIALEPTAGELAGALPPLAELVGVVVAPPAYPPGRWRAGSPTRAGRWSALMMAGG